MGQRGESDLDLVSDERSVTHFLLWLKHEPPLPSEQRQKDMHAPLMNHQTNTDLF